jgi:hypothetical protein
VTTLKDLIPAHSAVRPFFRARIDGETEVLVTAVLSRTAVVLYSDAEDTKAVIRLDRLTPVEPDKLRFVLKEAQVSAARGRVLSTIVRYGADAA